MTTTSTQPNRLENETAHYCEAEQLICGAQEAFRNGDFRQAELLAQFAAVHAQLSVAADHDRIAGCVPDGASRLGVDVGGRR